MNIKSLLTSIYLIVLVCVLYLLFSNVNFEDLFTYDFILRHKNIILDFRNNNYILFTAIFFLSSILWIFLLGFGTPIAILGGFIFGYWWGTLILLIAFSIGATSLYYVADVFFKDSIKKKFPKKFINLRKKFNENEFFYFLFYRFIGGGGLPFGLQNLLPVIFGMKLKNYFSATFLGLAPGMFILTSLGSGIESIIDPHTKPNIYEIIYTPYVYLPILGFLILLFISIFIKKIFFKDL